MHHRALFACAAACLLTPVRAAAAAADSTEPRLLRDIEFAQVAGQPLKMDLHLPAALPPREPLLVWVHGGAWRSGSRDEMPLRALVAEGYAIASVDYRLSTSAKFPAQIHDIKAAIRYLRARAATWRLTAEKIVVAGNSAGAHLAALTGVSNGHSDLEGSVGTNLQQSSAVQGIISFYGAANLTTILDQSTPHGLKVRTPALALLLGASPPEVPVLARLASPVFHVDAHDPPLLLLHGDQDPQMPINQSHELCGAYQNVKATVQFVVVHGAKHGGESFYDHTRIEIVKRFLQQHF